MPKSSRRGLCLAFVDINMNNYLFRFKARIIREMLADDSNYLYFQFALPIIEEFERVNALFQHEKKDPTILINNLVLLHSTLERRIHEHDGSEKKQDKIEFGAKFLSCINDFIEKKGKTEATLNQVNGIKSRCKSVLVEALDQVNQRLPPVANVFAELSNLNPSSVISQTNRPEFKNLPFPHLYEDKINQVDEQYRRLICMDVNAECFEGKGIPGDTELFWSALIKHESLKDLAEYALTCLTMPVSNASVERMFSILTAVKTKPRNRLHVQTLECIVRVRAELLLKKSAAPSLK